MFTDTGKIKDAVVLQWSAGGVLISLSDAIEPVGGYTTESVTVIFPAIEHHRLLAGANLYCLVNSGTCV